MSDRWRTSGSEFIYLFIDLFIYLFSYLVSYLFFKIKICISQGYKYIITNEHELQKMRLTKICPRQKNKMFFFFILGRRVDRRLVSDLQQERSTR